MYKTVVFDFDGTLVDSLGVIVKATNSLSERFGYPKIQDPEQLRHKGLRQVVREDLAMSWLAFARFVRVIRPKVLNETKLLHVRPQLRQLLPKLKKCRIGILTSNDRAVVMDVLRRDNLKMDFVWSERALFGKDRPLRKLLRQQGLKGTELLYVGDEIRDVEACQRAGVDVAAVTWGVNSAKALERAEPTHLIRNVAQLAKLLNVR